MSATFCVVFVCPLPDRSQQNLVIWGDAFLHPLKLKAEGHSIPNDTNQKLMAIFRSREPLWMVSLRHGY